VEWGDFREDLGKLGESEVRKMLSEGKYNERETPIVKEWLEGKRLSQQDKLQDRSLELAIESNTIAREANKISHYSNKLAWFALFISIMSTVYSYLSERNSGAIHP